jgi:acyl transferase domain-containing protein/acyl carrier protein
MDAFTGPGTSHNIVTGRLSYLFDFQGPSLVVDTACSSSLVAIHLAAQSLRSRESSMALAGGVNLVLSPHFTIALSRLQMLSPTGRCRAFDSRADGFVRSEGCGVIVLKRLADARAAGDRILAVIRGSAVNQDGRTNGITAPNSQSQQRVIARALANAGVAATDIGYVETHGTGTPLGDPIELEALSAAIGQASPNGLPCFIGSAKANLGHTEGAAGVAGVIKAVLSLQHAAIPPLALFERLNPHVTLEGTRFRIPTRLSPWEALDRPRLAGVSSFGWSGTNAHVILEEAPRVDREAANRPGPFVLPISARAEGALRQIAADYRALLAALPGPDLTDLCHTASVRRTAHDYRAAVTGETAEELGNGLQSFSNGVPTWRVAHGRAVSGRRASVVFVFCGQGPQWWAMGRELLSSNHVFRARIEQCSTLLEGLAGWSLVAALSADESESRLHETEVAQPAIFALQLGLAAVWESWGVVPAAVVGHSVGELAAAVIAGAMTTEEAMRVAYHRASLMQSATGGGKMVSVELTAEDAERAVRRFGGRVSVAAVNAARSCVLSGEPAAVDEVIAGLQARDIACRALAVNYAFHSAQMDGIARELQSALGSVVSRAPRFPLASTVTGTLVTGAALDAAYWARNVRQPVLFAPAIDGLADRGHRLFLEIGPHPVLGSSIATPQAAAPRVALASLHRGRPEQASLLASLGALYAAGYPVDWRRIHVDGRPVPLPRYPWQRDRYWLPDPGPASLSAGRIAEPTAALPLPGRLLRSPQLTSVVFECELSEHSPSWLADHVIDGATVVPGAAFMTMALAAAQQAMGAAAGVDDFFIHRPLPLPPGQVRTVQTIVAAQALEIQSIGQGDSDWTLHVTGRVVAQAASDDGGERPDAIHARCAVDVPAQDHYDGLARRGADLRPLFRTATRLSRRDGESIGDSVLASELMHEAARYPIHPTVIDGCLQPILAALPDGDARRHRSYLPQSVRRLHAIRAAAGAVSSHVVIRQNPEARDSRIVADVRVMDQAGMLVAQLDGVAFSEVLQAADRKPAAREPAAITYAMAWETGAMDASTAAVNARGAWLLFMDGQGVGEAFARALETAGQPCVRIAADASGSSPVLAGFDPRRPDAIESACTRLIATTGDVAGVAHFWSLDDASAAGRSPEEVEAGQRHACGSALAIIKALARRGAAGAAPLLLVTRGAQAAGGELSAPAQAAVWGLARVASLEHPDLPCVCIDLDPAASAEDSAASLFGCVQARQSDEREIAFRGGRRLTRRWIRREATAAPRDGGAGMPRVLDITVRGVLDNLSLQPLDRRPPGPGEIEIDVRASALNFRDVLNALGMYPGEAGRPGSECAGVVAAIGDGVVKFQVGDEVLALADGAMASHVTTPARRAVRKPAELTFEQAAALPIAFLTAEYALHDLAGLSRGERVLIHAAAGGVGLAAVQIAQRLGAEVYATAGSPEKHRVLRALGVKHVFSSRSLDFAAQIQEATGGRGVHVALNSLAGDFIPKTLSALGDRGRFVEIGKTGIWDAAAVRAARPDVTYHTLYLGEIFERDPVRTEAMLHQLAESIEVGSLRPLPLHRFDLEDAARGFRYMAQARHIGKVVLSPASAGTPRGGAAAVAADATYLVTGGLGSLGLHVAGWLVDAGAREIVLVGRRAPSASALQAIAALESRGARVVTLEANLAQRGDVDRVLARIATAMPPLRGIVHAAGVLDDGVILEQTWARLAGVMAPKVLGAWNLHEATRSLPLDFFVLFSSIASALGSPGQSNYAAANAVLDALAHHRRGQGLPGLSINWGPWSDGGMAAGAAHQISQRWRDRGLASLTPDEAIRAFGAALEGADAQVAIVNMDWAAYLRPFARVPGLLQSVAPDAGVPPAGAVTSLADTLAGAPPVRRMPMLVDYVHGRALHVLGLPGSHPLDPDQGLRDVGLDSLMAVELRNELQSRVAVHLPTTLAFDYPTVNAIAKHLAAALALDTGVPRAEAQAPVDSFAEQLGDLSDADAEALLNAELSGAHPPGGSPS